ncbi:hypothetical protein TCAP_05154 [Tolypocladium capitatum]|uniref:Uncharacterized protein n=1 Tax=Tolypocladium capitatum TaxID=45235 RepID=A0A2K3QBF1_9HYPO|nr:hypothetical protein TCAP_05154 [Tolypocladium capitatum]
MYFSPHLVNGLGRANVVLTAVFCDVEVGFVDASTLKPRVIFCENLSHFMRLCGVFLKVGFEQYEVRAQLLGHKGGHAGPAAKLSGDIIASRQDTAPDRKWLVFELRSFQLLYSGIKGIAVDVDDVLREVPRYFELSDQAVCVSKVDREILPIQLPLSF